MTVVSKTYLKTKFVTGARPTQQDFDDLIDSYQQLFTSAQASAGTVGLQILATNTTAQAQSILDIPSFGAFGRIMASASTTAIALNALGGGVTGLQIFAVTTTAQAQSIILGGVGTTGTGAQVLQTSPTLISPVLGSAQATAINFGSQNLSAYAEGTWTPADASGAGLVITSDSCLYTRVGRMVIATFSITYPSTASGATATIGGLPFTVNNSVSNGINGGAVTLTTVTTFICPFANANTATFAWTGVNNTVYTNANLSLKVMRGMIIYTV